MKSWAGIGLATLFVLAGLSSITTDLSLASMCLGLALLVGYGGFRYGREYQERRAAYEEAVRESPEPRHRPPNR
ncbi:hypothetical protein [Mariniluteicoccus endophyticus]